MTNTFTARKNLRKCLYFKHDINILNFGKIRIARKDDLLHDPI